MDRIDSLLIRNLRAEEMPEIIDMAAGEGWNPGCHDAFAFYRADPDGFFVGELAGVPVAYISAVIYNDVYGFVGLYIVHPAWRGKGYGLTLWKHALARLGDLPTGLDGVPAQVENYKKAGFEYAFRQMRLVAPAIAVLRSQYASVNRPSVEHIDTLIQYDSAVFGTPRRAFVVAWMAMPHAEIYCSFTKGRISGYAVIRKCMEGYKIGPLFADSESLAEQLFLACHAVAKPGENVYIDMPETNPATVRWMSRYGLRPVFETVRMYKNGILQFPLEKVFGITCFELG